MANEYATRTELKDWLGIGDTDQDTTLDIILEAASRAVDDYCHRHFYAETSASARVFTAEGRFVFVDDISETDSLAVAVDDAYDGTYDQTWTLDDYSGDYGFRLVPYNAIAKSKPAERLEAISRYWPSTRSAVEVTAKWGWPAVPPAVKQATLMVAHAAWTPSGIQEETGGVPNVQSVSLDGSDSVTYAAANTAVLAAMELEKDAQAMLKPYRKARLVW